MTLTDHLVPTYRSMLLMFGEGAVNSEEAVAQMTKRFHDEGGELYVPAE